MNTNTNTNIPFCVKFTIFYERTPLTPKQIDLMNKIIHDDIEKILKFSVEEMKECKILDRAEPRFPPSTKKNNYG